MFCLRNWIALLVFLTNASPLYVFLFLTATYALQRPCVYCSILLFVLIFSLFDFEADWFEPRQRQLLSSSSFTSFTQTATSFFSGNATIAEALNETASIAFCAINGTAGSLAGVATEGAKRRMASIDGKHSVEAVGSGFEWLRGLLEKVQFRIPCVDVVVRL